MDPSNLLEVKNLVKKYGHKKAVDGLSFFVKKGEVVGLLGPNGAGKTTAFYMTIGLIRPDEGEVFFQGKNVTGLAVHERASLGFGYLAQEPSIFRSLTVEENILCILETLDLNKEERKKRLVSLLNELRLSHLRKVKAASLSGGERRRLEITRALVKEPTLLLLDEPFANIDPLAIADVKQLIHLLTKKGIAVLITDHNAREIFSIGARSYLVQGGKVVLSGTVDELLANEEAKRTYFGYDFKI
jgi:lipopolysaccharide export system ATP-binding protein